MVIGELNAKVGSGNTNRVTATGTHGKGGITEMETCPVISEQQMGLLLVDILEKRGKDAGWDHQLVVAEIKMKLLAVKKDRSTRSKYCILKLKDQR